MEDSVDLQKTADDFLKIVNHLSNNLDLKMFLIQIKVVSNWKFILDLIVISSSKKNRAYRAIYILNNTLIHDTIIV